MKQSLPVRITVGVFLFCMVAMALGLPAFFAVDGAIALATTEPVRVTDVSCTYGTGRHSSNACYGAWTLSDGTEVRGKLSGDWFVGEDEDFDGYGNTEIAAPMRMHWMMLQLLYAIPIFLIVAFIRFHRRRLKNAGQPLSAADEAAMNARAEQLRRNTDPPPSSADLGKLSTTHRFIHRPTVDNWR